VKNLSRELSGRKSFQAEGIAGVKSLRYDCDLTHVEVRVEKSR
jgi:hypothetical protein